MCFVVNQSELETARQTEQDRCGYHERDDGPCPCGPAARAYFQRLAHSDVAISRQQDGQPIFDQPYTVRQRI